MIKWPLNVPGDMMSSQVYEPWIAYFEISLTEPKVHMSYAPAHVDPQGRTAGRRCVAAVGPRIEAAAENVDRGPVFHGGMVQHWDGNHEVVGQL